MKKALTILLALIALTAALSACGNAEPAPTSAPGTETATQSEALQTLAPTAEAPFTTDEPVVNTHQSPLTEFKSDFGYSLSYDESSFDYRRTEGYDEFVLQSDEVDKPFVFICVSHVDAEFVDQVKAAALGDNPEDCSVGQAQTAGQCVQTEEDWAGGKVIHKTYMCPLASGGMLLVETQRYTEQADDPYAARLMEMVNSMQLS